MSLLLSFPSLSFTPLSSLLTSPPPSQLVAHIIVQYPQPNLQQHNQIHKIVLNCSSSSPSSSSSSSFSFTSSTPSPLLTLPITSLSPSQSSSSPNLSLSIECLSPLLPSSHSLLHQQTFDILPLFLSSIGSYHPHLNDHSMQTDTSHSSYPYIHRYTSPGVLHNNSKGFLSFSVDFHFGDKNSYTFLSDPSLFILDPNVFTKIAKEIFQTVLNHQNRNENEENTILHPPFLPHLTTLFTSLPSSSSFPLLLPSLSSPSPPLHSQFLSSYLIPTIQLVLSYGGDGAKIVFLELLKENNFFILKLLETAGGRWSHQGDGKGNKREKMKNDIIPPIVSPSSISVVSSDSSVPLITESDSLPSPLVNYSLFSDSPSHHYHLQYLHLLSSFSPPSLPSPLPIDGYAETLNMIHWFWCKYRVNVGGEWSGRGVGNLVEDMKYMENAMEMVGKYHNVNDVDRGREMKVGESTAGITQDGKVETVSIADSPSISSSSSPTPPVSTPVIVDSSAPTPLPPSLPSSPLPPNYTGPTILVNGVLCPFNDSVFQSIWQREENAGVVKFIMGIGGIVSEVWGRGKEKNSGGGIGTEEGEESEEEVKKRANDFTIWLDAFIHKFINENAKSLIKKKKVTTKAK